jgi:ABC-2 type transport system permease protein
VWLFAHILRVTTSAAMWILVGRLIGSEDVVRFLVIGQIAIVGPLFAGWAIQSFTWDRMFVGTYPLQVAAPCSLVPVMLGRTLISLLNGIATSMATLIVLAPVFGLSVAPTRAPWAILILVLLCATAYGFAFCVGSLINWAPRLRNVVHNGAFIVISGICGVTVPVAFWPAWVQTMAHALPITSGLQGLRLLLDGGPASAVTAHVAVEALVGLAWFAAGTVTLDQTVNVARRHGAIDLM